MKVYQVVGKGHEDTTGQRKENGWQWYRRGKSIELESSG